MVLQFQLLRSLQSKEYPLRETKNWERKWISHMIKISQSFPALRKVIARGTAGVAPVGGGHGLHCSRQPGTIGFKGPTAEHRWKHQLMVSPWKPISKKAYIADRERRREQKDWETAERGTRSEKVLHSRATFPEACGGSMLEQRNVKRKEQQRETAMYWL